MNAHYFDGVDARLHAVTLTVADGHIAIDGDGIARRVAVTSTRWSAPAANAPAMLYLTDGAVCEVPHDSARAALARALGHRAQWRAWRSVRTLGAILALAVLVGVVALVGWRLFPAMANVAVRVMPTRIDQRLGEWSLIALRDDGSLQPSRIAPGLAREAAQVLARVTPVHPRVPLRLYFAWSSKIGINAEALPDGTILLTDQLIWSLAGKSTSMNAYQQAALAGILAHEIGHLEARDTVRGLVGGSLLQTLSAVLFGDFSDGVAATSAHLVELRYARAQETAADDWTIVRMQQLHLPLSPLAQWFEVVEAWYARAHNGPPEAVPTYFSTHPATAERIAKLRAADQAMPAMPGR